jgi:hypothetical protein
VGVARLRVAAEVAGAERMARRGPRTRLTDAVIDKVCNARSIGASLTICGQHVGVVVATIHDWRARGRAEQDCIDAGETPDPDAAIYLKFHQRFEESETNAALTWLQVIDKAASIDPSWARWQLRVRYPEDYTEIDRRELTGPGGGPVPITYVEVERPSE